MSPTSSNHAYRLVLATRNPGKVREFQRLLKELAPGVEWLLVGADEAGLPDIDETGTTFAQNARVKAEEAYRHCGEICLGEDSGLEVDYLGGAPGVSSHRFSPSGSDQDNNLLLLSKLKGIPDERRTARYKCAIAVWGRGGRIAQEEGSAEGRILREPRGTNGFGYDPLFFSTALGRSFGESTDLEKDSVSHRRSALAKILPALLGEGPI